MKSFKYEKSQNIDFFWKSKTENNNENTYFQFRRLQTKLFSLKVKMRRFEVCCKVRKIIRTETFYAEMAPFLSVGL